MPTYEYRCTACGHRFEEWQRITAAPLEICPLCSGELQRLPGGGGGILIRGAGFSRGIPCERDQTCCGRDHRCEKPPCGGDGG